MSNLYIVSGPSGSSKTTTMRKVMSNEVISFTTRDRRYGEIPNIDYVFITESEFQERMASGDIAESTTYYGTARYGITMTELIGKLRKGDAFVVVDAVGKAQLEEILKDSIYNTVSIFFRADPKDARARMIARGDDEKRVMQRMITFEEELNNFYLYDYIIDSVQGKQNLSVEAVKTIIDEVNAGYVS